MLVLLILFTCVLGQRECHRAQLATSTIDCNGFYSHAINGCHDLGSSTCLKDVSVALKDCLSSLPSGYCWTGLLNRIFGKSIRLSARLIPDPNVANSTGIDGLIDVSQSSDKPVTVRVRVRGLVPNSKHGLHIHTSGNITSGNSVNCTLAGAHFNPFGQDHGSPEASIHHYGDFGNIVADSRGRVDTRFTLPSLNLFTGPLITDRAFVLHAHPDDLGLTADPLSKTTGNSGAREACGVIHLVR